MEKTTLSEQSSLPKTVLQSKQKFQYGPMFGSAAITIIAAIILYPQPQLGQQHKICQIETRNTKTLGQPNTSSIDSQSIEFLTSPNREPG